jgi:hypothetical protein
LGVIVSEWKHPLCFETVSCAASNHDEVML